MAFAMTGNRVEKTLRKAGLRKFIGDQWFFPTVEEAVQYCVKHQHARWGELVDEVFIADVSTPHFTHVMSIIHYIYIYYVC